MSDTPARNRALIDWLPENYPHSGETVTFQEAIQPEADALWRLRQEFLLQLDPYQATWGLPYWEDSLGLNGSEGLTLDTRRRQVVAKLQGRGTTTVQVVRDLAETLLNVPVSVTEWYSEYRVELEPETSGGLPDGALSLRERLEEIMPAHLDWQIVIRTWADYIISAAAGPRVSRSSPPRPAVEMPGQHIYYGVGPGPAFSATGPPEPDRTMPGTWALFRTDVGVKISCVTPPGGKIPTSPAVTLSAGRCGGPVSQIYALPAFQI